LRLASSAAFGGASSGSKSIWPRVSVGEPKAEARSWDADLRLPVVVLLLRAEPNWMEELGLPSETDPSHPVLLPPPLPLPLLPSDPASEGWVA
jgi:hypothetical protein